ncbi:MAG: xanthine dehydrogenase family protein molybdopterin-binding subunit [Deltaproteobacteria bacterium]|nr:xanthine dehydrogenase family protein molybdopterin-binding subunit [Deltaproteobacteria bacterium]
MKSVRTDYPDFRIVGQNLPRIDLAAKLTGQAVFAEDYAPGGAVLHAKVLRSPHAHARVKRLEVSKARALPGVRAVMTATDLPDLRYGRYLRDERYMARVGDTVLFVGDRVAAVAADTLEIAKQALRLIEVDYEVLPPILTPQQAMAPDAPILHPGLGGYTVLAMAKPGTGNMASENLLERGDPDGAFAKSARVFEQVYTTEMVHQAYLEPHACLARYNPDGTYTVHASTQATFPLRNTISDALGVPQNQVRVVPTEVGGGFGGKISMLDELGACVLSRLAGGVPVRLVLSREEDLIASEPRSGFHMTFRTGVTAEGQLLARTIDILLDNGAFARAGVLTSASVPGFAEGPYHIPHLRVRTRCLYTNKNATASMRAPGGPQLNFALESEMERIAEEMGWDSIAFRRNNAMPKNHVTLAGTVMNNVNVLETLDAALELSGYSSTGTHPGPGRGRGLALGNWNVGGMPSGAVLKLNDDGSCSILTGVVDLTGMHTALVQIVSEALHLPPAMVTVKTLDTESAPHSTISAGSQALKSMGGAVLKAAGEVRRQLFEAAVQDLDASPDRMELAEGVVRIAGEPKRSVPVTKLIARTLADSGPIVGLGRTGSYTRLPAFAAHVVDVAVDLETGQVRLTRFCAAQDCGIAINPQAVDGQVQGGVVQGIGMALTEAVRYDDQGRPRAKGFLDYKIPSSLDVPDIETVLVEKPAVDGPFGAKGIGEPPAVPPPAAIANAIYHACGVRITSLPITPEKIRAALHAQSRHG